MMIGEVQKHEYIDKQKRDWFILTGRGASQFVAWGKCEPMLMVDPIMEPGDVWFAFGKTREKAREILQNELDKVIMEKHHG